MAERKETPWFREQRMKYGNGRPGAHLAHATELTRFGQLRENSLKPKARNKAQRAAARIVKVTKEHIEQGLATRRHLGTFLAVRG